MPLEKCFKVVLTGGPGGGKTTALDLFRRELSHDVEVVPEAASILFRGGLPRSNNANVKMCTQKAIFQLQKSLEAIQKTLSPEKILLCDRGTLDGAAYWPQPLANPQDNSEDNFFKYMNTNFESELSQYDAVIFFETAAANGNSITSNNPIRTEGQKEAIELDQKLHKIWSQHPNFHFVPSHESFIKKIMFGIMTLENVIGQSKKT